TTRYYAWYEMYPSLPVTISMTINPGNSITASVDADSSGNFTLSLTNTTTGAKFSTQQSLPGAARSSAEWIQEAPSSFFGVLPLANFGTMSFSSASATINGTSGSIGSFSPNASITMVTGFGPHSQVKALPSALDSATGSSFAVTWKSSGSKSVKNGNNTH